MKRGPENQLSSSSDEKKAKSTINSALSYLTLPWNYLFGTASASDAGFEIEDHPLLDKSMPSPLVSNNSSLKQAYHEVMFKFLDNKSLVNFASTCRQARELHKPVVKARALANLMQAVALGNQDLAQRILEGHPQLLTDKSGNATEYSGKRIQGVTPFQAALLGDDIDMAEMMKPYFGEIQDGEALMQDQAKAIFPEGIEAHRHVQEKTAFDFSGIMLAIIDAPIDEVKLALNKQFDNNLELHKALENFRNQFAQISLNEQAFNVYHYLQALAQYDELFKKTDSWDRKELVWCQVVGWTQRFFSACWAQTTAQGVGSLEEKYRRSFKFCSSEDCLFPLEVGAGVGLDAAVDARGRPGGARQTWELAGGRSGWWDWGPRGFFEILSKRKASDFIELFQASSRLRCSV